MSEKYLEAQIKKANKILERAQKENAKKKKPFIEKLDDMKMRGMDGTPEFDKLKEESDKIQTISDGTKKTYSDTAAAVLREAYNKFGVTYWKDLTPEQTQSIIQDRIDSGQKPNTIRKVVHALDYIQNHATATRVFKEEGEMNIINHDYMLNTLKEQKIIRHSEDSHRYKASPDEAEAVLKEMEKINPYLASIARYEYLTGFRISESIRQKAEYIKDDRHLAIKAKGGLNNVVYTNHHTAEEKAFIDDLKANPETSTGRIFHRQPDGDGGFKSDEQIRRAVTQLASRCADKLGIKGPKGETFSSHSFRGAFALNRMDHYAANYKNIDQIIADKIREQPRLAKKYENFENRIKEKTNDPDGRDIRIYEKIQWLVSTDLNHSRQDIVRYYVTVKAIMEALAKYGFKE